MLGKQRTANLFMFYNIKVITNARQNRVEKIRDDLFKVYTSVKPEKGKANESVIKLLAEHLKVAKSRLSIKSGEKARNKVIKVY